MVAALARLFRSGRRGGARRDGHSAGAAGGSAGEVATLENAPAWEGWAAQSDTVGGRHADGDGGGSGVASSPWSMVAAEEEAIMESNILAAVDKLYEHEPPAVGSATVGGSGSSQEKEAHGGGGGSDDRVDNDRNRRRTHPADGAAEPFGTDGPLTFGPLSEITTSLVSRGSASVGVSSDPLLPPPSMPPTLLSPPPMPAELWTPMPGAAAP